jgi:hypothetical protein
VSVWRVATPEMPREKYLRPPTPARLFFLTALLIEGVVDRGVRMTEQGAVPDNGIAVEPREAQRPTSLAARTPQAANPGDGDLAVGARRASVIGPPKGGVAHRPGASRRSIPSFRGETENRETGIPGARKQSPGPAERWLFNLLPNWKFIIPRNNHNTICLFHNYHLL